MNNPYSKYRYDNGIDVKFRVNDLNTHIYGVELRALKDNIKSQMPDTSTSWINNGATWVLNNVFKCNQINKVDQPVVDDKNASKLTFFKLFKL